jgi:hypothetical protein
MSATSPIDAARNRLSVIHHHQKPLTAAPRWTNVSHSMDVGPDCFDRATAPPLSLLDVG